MDTVKVAIIGFGTIGSGVARILLESNERISRQVGKRVELVQVVDPDINRHAQYPASAGNAHAGCRQVTDNPEIKAVVQLIGGIEPDRRYHAQSA